MWNRSIVMKGKRCNNRGYWMTAINVRLLMHLFLCLHLRTCCVHQDAMGTARPPPFHMISPYSTFYKYCRANQYISHRSEDRDAFETLPSLNAWIHPWEECNHFLNSQHITLANSSQARSEYILFKDISSTV